jgi:hypothetical protein
MAEHAPTILAEVTKLLGGTASNRETEARKAGARFRADKPKDPIAERAAVLQAQKSYDDLVARVTADVWSRLTKAKPAGTRKIMEAN